MVTPQQQRWRLAAAACVSAVALSSCGTGPPSARATQALPSTPAVLPQVVQQSDETHDQAALPDVNDRACVGVEAIIGHITVDTVRWSPNLKPFDQGIATRLAMQTRYLDQQALGAGLRVRRAVAATATAFGDVAHAIMAKNRARLDRAIAHSRTAYSGLKKVCKIRN